QQSVPSSLAAAMVRSGKMLGVATSRALSELDEVFDGSGVTRPLLMNGPVILEDGGLVLVPGSTQLRLMVSRDQYEAVSTFMDHVRDHLSPIAGDSKWVRLGTVEAPLVHVPSYYDYRVSGSIWQQVIGGVPRHLERTMEWCRDAVRTLGIESLVQLTEIGDGT